MTLYWVHSILTQPRFRKNLLAVFVEGTISFIAHYSSSVVNIPLKISIIGFLFGFSLASSFAAYHLLEEYQRASAALQTSIEELKVSTEKVSIGWEYVLLDADQSLVQVSAHVRRIEAVEKDLKALSDASASKEDISRVRAEVKKIYDGLHIGKRNRNFLIIPI